MNECGGYGGSVQCSCLAVIVHLEFDAVLVNLDYECLYYGRIGNTGCCIAVQAVVAHAAYETAVESAVVVCNALCKLVGDVAHVPA